MNKDKDPFFEPRPCATCGHVFSPTPADLTRKQQHIKERGKWSFSGQWPSVCSACALERIMNYEDE